MEQINKHSFYPSNKIKYNFNIMNTNDDIRH